MLNIKNYVIVLITITAISCTDVKPNNKVKVLNNDSLFLDSEMEKNSETRKMIDEILKDLDEKETAIDSIMSVN